VSPAQKNPAAPPARLRPGLLEGVAVALAGAAQASAADAGAGQPGAAVRGELEALGARVLAFDAVRPDAPLGLEDGDMEKLAGELLGGAPALDAVVVDGAAMYAAGSGRDALRACLDGTWAAVRAIANAAFIGPGRPGRVILLAPAPDAGAGADAARAGLENLARTLSIEWSRHGITAVAVAPGAARRGGAADSTRGGPQEVAALCAYLLSPAGAYFSGCLLDLRGADAAV
jgi:NAD(P)-dependent dehydrogenase (short-subunit alcohol dehydrogenase family)